MSSSRPKAADENVRRRMQSTRRRDTPAEVALRSALHRQGLRFRVDVPPLPELRRRADIVFRPAKVAVFVHGCYWHGCPTHGTWPKRNAKWWREKIEANRSRDADTIARLTERGWVGIEVWEHDDPSEAAEEIAKLVETRRPR